MTTTAPQTEVGTADDRRPRVARWPASGSRALADLLSRWWVIALVLLGVYAATSQLMDPGGHLITDVGGKTATLQAMVERGDWDPDLGYWFEEADPEGTVYPFDKTRLTNQGQWVNATSFTMIYPARPLWAIGGPRAALLLPMLGAVAAALAAGALHRRVAPGTSGAASAWVVGLASPMFIYAVDFWEHSLGVGLMAWAIVAVIDAIDDESRWWPAAVAGIGYALAATMRQEALAYGFVGGITLVVVTFRQGGFRHAATRGALMATGCAAVLGGYSVLETMVTGGSFRNSRSVATAGSGIDLGERFTTSTMTTLFPFNGFDGLALVDGFLLFGTLLWLGWSMVSGRSLRPAAQAAGLVWGVSLVLLIWLGPGFVPGLVPAAPLATLGLVAGIHRRRWIVLALGLGPLPLVLATAFSGGSLVQWGGRYQLTTGLVLVVLALSLVGGLRSENGRPPGVVLALVGVSVFITGFGVLWGIERTRAVATDWDTLGALTDPDDVVVWRDPVFAREAGAFMPGRRWLAAPHDEQQVFLASALSSQNVEAFVWLDDPDGELESFAGFTAGEQVGELDFFPIRLTRFERTG